MNSRRILPFLLLLFVASGCAALIYEVVWFQLLQLVIGSSAVSLAVLLGTYMGGLCLGSLALPRLIAARYHPLRVYAAARSASAPSPSWSSWVCRLSPVCTPRGRDLVSSASCSAGWPPASAWCRRPC